MIGVCVSGHQTGVMPQSLLLIEIIVESRTASAPVDMGCVMTVVSSQLVERCVGESYMVAFDRSDVKYQGKQKLKITVTDVEMAVEVIVSDTILAGIDVVLEMNALSRLGGVRVDAETVGFGFHCCMRRPRRHSRQLMLKVG